MLDTSPRHDRDLIIEDKLFLVTFLPEIQSIVYTAKDCTEAGQFKVQNGWIVSKQPSDSTLQEEVIQYKGNHL
jgi:hypothetical protein